MKSTIEELKQIHICGRTTITNGAVNLFWGASGLDFCFSGSEIASCYEYICNITDNITSTGSELHAHDRYDFTEWPADVVLVNLGTNDEGAFHNPAFVDSETGIVYQNKMLSDGNYEPQSIHKVIEGQKNFIKTIRKNNPNAMIIWCYGMCGKQLSAFLEDGVMEYCRENQDEKVFYLELPEMTEETIGSREHPGPECHIQASKLLSTFICERT